MSQKVSNASAPVEIASAYGASLHMRFAQLQFSAAALNKENALEKMAKIEEEQTLQKSIAQNMQTLRNNKKDVKADAKPGDKVAISQDVVDFAATQGIQATLKDGKMTIKQSEDLMQGLQSALDRVGTNTQLRMVDVQDKMGAYSAYVGGVNSIIQQGLQLTNDVAKMR